MWFETLESLIKQSDETQFDFQELGWGSRAQPRRSPRGGRPGAGPQGELQRTCTRPPPIPRRPLLLLSSKRVARGALGTAEGRREGTRAAKRRNPPLSHVSSVLFLFLFLEQITTLPL